MDPLLVSLSRWQFAITTVYHFFFVPLSIGLAVLVAAMQTVYVIKGDEAWKRMTKFWGKLFLINFAVGVVTGIVMEFQFGMNWSEYSRFVGDIFGAPLAIEALLAFFLESIFLGVWIFGWDRLPKKVHLASIWLVAFGTIVSAFWILVANSFMQHPVGFEIDGGRMTMQQFSALVANPYVWGQFPHTIFSAFTTGAFFVLGISAWHLVREHEVEIFRPSFSLAAGFGAFAVALVILVGHSQAQRMVQLQPMKMAAAEALWESEDPASMSIFSWINESERREVISIRIPRLLSVLAFNRFDGEVTGINQLQAEYEAIYGPGRYFPAVALSYWSFRIMVGAGFAMLALAFYALYRVMRGHVPQAFRWLALFPFAIALPYLANSFGWILTESGRQPWVVYGLMKTEQAASPAVTAGMVAASLATFTIIYGLLIAIDIYLLRRFATAGVEPERGSVVPDLEELTDLV